MDSGDTIEAATGLPSAIAGPCLYIEADDSDGSNTTRHPARAPVRVLFTTARTVGILAP